MSGRRGTKRRGQAVKRPISARRRRELRWIFGVIFAANALGSPVLARQVPFSSQQVITTLANGASSVVTADVDGDGDLDVLSASYSDDKIAWYENTDGAGTFGSQQVITTLAYGAMSVFAADVDGDGDLDVLSAEYSAYSIAWYKNIDGAGTFGTRQEITSLVAEANWVHAADVDGDGDLDVLSSGFRDDKIAWYENTDGAGTFGTEQGISSVNKPVWVHAADVDGDGDLDVMSASYFDDKIAWYENTDGAGTFGSQQVISTDADGPSSAFAADVDGDGDLDALSASSDDKTIAWYENTDGAGTFGSQQEITSAAGSPISIFAADIDQDGDLDVLSATYGDDDVAWYENFDGDGTFTTKHVITTLVDNGRSVYAADVDGDGDMDVLSASSGDDKIAWYENETIHSSAFFPQQSVITTLANSAVSVYAADVDGDGDIDVLSGSVNDDKVAWYENAGGAGIFGSQQVITTLADGTLSVFAADVDGDGDVDALSASAFDDKIAWYENTDGAGSFGTQQVITTLAGGAESVFAADIDGDGDLDVLSASWTDTKVAWYENTDGGGSFGTQQVITTLANGARSVVAADVDRDGDLDVLSASVNDDKIAWYENADGDGTFGSQQVITTLADDAFSVFAADLDGDGDLDALSASEADDKIAWYAYNDGSGTFGSQQVISTTGDSPRSVFAADVDGDGDLDVLSASRDDDKIAWYENTNGGGAFGPEQVITTVALGAFSVHAADVDGDGDLDPLSASTQDEKIAWYENRGGQFSLGTTDVAQQVVANSQVEDLLAIEVTHNGRTGDSPLELASLDLRLTDGAGAALTEAQALALFQTVRVYLDDGSGALDGADTLVVSTSDFSSITTDGDGVLTLPFADGDANAQVAFGAPRTFFVVVEMTANAEAQTPGAFAFEHRTESSSAAEDANADIPLTLEYVADLQSAKVDTALSTSSCQAPFDLRLANRTIDATVICEAGTVLTAGNNVTVVTPGNLTFRAGQKVQVSHGFSVVSGSFTADIDPGLEP